MNLEKINLKAQQIVFAFEDNFDDVEKRKMFNAMFDKYLAPLDPDGIMEPYDVIVQLGRKDALEFERMLEEMKNLSLLPD
jgi:hypothetical protein